MQEHCPLIPRVLQSAGQLVHIGHDAEAALCVRMQEWISSLVRNLRQRRLTTRRQFEQGFGRFAGQVVGQFKQRILIRSLYIGQPFLRHAIGQQLCVAVFCEEFRFFLRGRRAFFDVLWNEDFFNTLANFDELGCAGGRMHFKLASLGPLIGPVVMIDIAQQQAARRLVDDHADIAADAHRPEIRIFGPVELVKAHALAARINLQIERCGLGSLLLIPGQAGEAGGKRIGYAEFHQFTLNTFITSSPR
ncbi:hypothetical protein D3C87_1306520 [compost metagenome]